VFVKLLLQIRIWFRRLPRNTIWVQPVAGGLLVGLLALYYPQVMGVGYDYIERVLSGDMALKVVALLAVLKIVATATCYSSGNAGGIFGPSLFIGAMLGGVVGSIAHGLFPAYTATPGAYALVGMGAAFAGIIRTPFTSVIMIFELTRDYSIIVPLMIANMISFFISQRLQEEPIYDAIASQDGIVLPAGESREHLAKLHVASAMRDEPEQLPSEPANYVHRDHSLSIALERMGAAGVEVLPVVSRANIQRQLGTVAFSDVLRAYGITEPASRADRH
jgi:CIC family chloride channel protein